MLGISFLKRHSRAFFAGFVDKFNTRVTGKTICFGKAMLIKMGECDPWSDHIDIHVFPEVNKALLNKDFESARNLIKFGAMLNEGNKQKGFCVSLALKAVDFFAQGDEFLISATPFYYLD